MATNATATEAPKRSTKPTCYVCGNPIRGKVVHAGPFLCRHQRCEPGSARYMKNRKLARAYLAMCGSFVNPNDTRRT